MLAVDFQLFEGTTEVLNHKNIQDSKFPDKVTTGFIFSTLTKFGKAREVGNNLLTSMIIP